MAWDAAFAATATWANPSVPPGTPAPTVEEARAFLAAFDRDVRPVLLAGDRASWEYSVDGTAPSQAAMLDADAKLREFVVERVRASRRFDAIELPADL